MITLRRPKKVSLSLDMTPLIDVVFQLLIFFMLTASFTAPAMKLNLPRAAAKEDAPQTPITISVNQEGRIFINNEATDKNQLIRQLTSLLAGQKQKAVAIRGQEDMPYKFFVEIMDMARQAGAVQVNIVHQQKGRP